MTLSPITAWLQGQELMLIFVLVLLLFGAKKLPEFARGLGKSLGEFKKARSEFENEINRAALEEPTPPRPQPAPQTHQTEQKLG